MIDLRSDAVIVSYGLLTIRLINKHKLYAGANIGTQNA